MQTYTGEEGRRDGGDLYTNRNPDTHSETHTDRSTDILTDIHSVDPLSFHPAGAMTLMWDLIETSREL